MAGKTISRTVLELLKDRDKLSIPQLQVLRDELKSMLKEFLPSTRGSLGDNPATFAETMAGAIRTYKFQLAPHIEYISRRIQAFSDGQGGGKVGLLISTPPRHSKSETCSFWTPLWLLHRNPRTRILLASYEATFAETWGRRVRDFILDNSDKLDLHLDPDHASAAAWSLREGGSMHTAGVGGPLTGRGGDVIIIDDPIKNSEEASSQVYRDKAWAWFNSVALTRLEPGGFIIAIGTRWHEDDLLGRLEAASASGEGLAWEVIKFPSLAELGDPLGRPRGAALWPERYPSEKLQEIRKSLGPYQFSALYQQNPTPEEGNSVQRRWWKFYQESPQEIAEKAEKSIQTWDLAVKETATGSFTVGFILAKIGSLIYVVDRFRKRVNTPEMLVQVEQWHAKYPKALAKLVEDKAAGPALISMLHKRIPGLIAWPPRGSKMQRLNAVLPLIEAGNVLLPNTQWAKELIEEAAAFPNGTHDDQVDALVQGLTYLQPDVWAKLEEENKTVQSREKAQETIQSREVGTQFHRWIRGALKDNAKAINTGRRSIQRFGGGW